MTIRTLLLAAALALMPLSAMASGRAVCLGAKEGPGWKKELESLQLNPLTWQEMLAPKEQRDARSNSTVTTRLRLIAWSQVLSCVT